MSALTTDQWYAKLQKFVPSWYFEEPDGECAALYYSLAAMFSQIQEDTDSQQAACFILTSSAPVIDLIGAERECPRLPGESTAAYAVRMQNSLFLPVGETELQSVIDAALNNGEAFLIDNQEYGFFDDADITETNGIPYFDDYWTRWLISQKTYNWWTAIIPEQTGGVDATIQATIIASIEANKAEGTTYDILYKSASDTDTDD
jgi:hypothetical protein